LLISTTGLRHGARTSHIDSSASPTQVRPLTARWLVICSNGGRRVLEVCPKGTSCHLAWRGLLLLGGTREGTTQLWLKPHLEQRGCLGPDGWTPAARARAKPLDVIALLSFPGKALDELVREANAA